MSQVVALCAHDPAATFEKPTERSGLGGQRRLEPVASDRGDELLHRREDVVGRPDPRIVVDSGKLEQLRPWDLLSDTGCCPARATRPVRQLTRHGARTSARRSRTSRPVLSSASRQAIHMFDARVPVRENRMHRSMQRREEIGPFGSLVRHRRLPPALPPPASASALVFAPKAGPRRLFRLGEREPRRTAGLAPTMDDHEELVHRGCWLLQSAIAEVARQAKSRALDAVGSRP